MDAAVDGLAALSVSDDDSWESRAASSRGGDTARWIRVVAGEAPPRPGENSSSANVAGKKPSIAEIKAAGRAKVKAQQEAVAAEVEEQSRASSLWSAAFDYTFDSTTDPEAILADFLLHGQRVLVFVPGFASWLSLTQEHVERWKDAAVLENPINTARGEAGGGSASASAGGAADAMSIAFKWQCGEVIWANEDAQVEAAAEWQVAHEATIAAARSLTKLLQKLKDLGCSIVVAGHSLGARVALQALANDLMAPGIDAGGAAVDNYALNPSEWAELPDEHLRSWCEANGAAPAPPEFPFNRLMAKCAFVAIAHSSKDRALTAWPAAEYARCGRVAPAALADGPREEELEAEQFDEAWMERVMLFDVTQEVARADGYLHAKGVTASLREALDTARAAEAYAQWSEDDPWFTSRSMHGRETGRGPAGVHVHIRSTARLACRRTVDAQSQSRAWSRSSHGTTQLVVRPGLYVMIGCCARALSATRGGPGPNQGPSRPVVRCVRVLLTWLLYSILWYCGLCLPPV